MFPERDGEEALPFNPARAEPDAGVVFVGRVLSPWLTREECPKNMAAARETGRPAAIVVDVAYRAGLAGLDAFSHAVILTWLDRSPRNLIVQKPRHAESPRGTFAVRSPVRPNPIGVHVVRITDIDAAQGRISLDAIDVLDGTPVIDIKPYYPSTDSIADARTTRAGQK